MAGPGANPDAVEPAQVAARLNALCPMASNGDHYFTLIHNRLDVRTRRFRFTVAGHPAPILTRAGHPPQRLDISGFALGMDEADDEESVLDLQPGDSRTRPSKAGSPRRSQA